MFGKNHADRKLGIALGRLILSNLGEGRNAQNCFYSPNLRFRTLITNFIGALFVVCSSLGAAVISDWSLTDSTLSFNLSGNGFLENAPPAFANALYVGVPGDSDWINETFNVATVSPGSIDGSPVIAFSWVSKDSGDFIGILGNVPQPFDFTDGGDVNLAVSITGNSNVFSPENLLKEDLIVSWGGTSGGAVPSPDFAIGAFGTVPEPRYSTLFAVIILTMFAALKRHICHSSVAGVNK